MQHVPVPTSEATPGTRTGSSVFPSDIRARDERAQRARERERGMRKQLEPEWLLHVFPSNIRAPDEQAQRARERERGMEKRLRMLPYDVMMMTMVMATRTTTMILTLHQTRFAPD